MRASRLVVLALAAVQAACATAAASLALQPGPAAMRAFLTDRADPLWSFSNATASQPTLWFEGPFAGNGMLGLLATVGNLGYARPAIQLDVGRADVWDVRVRGSPYHTNNSEWDTARLPVGKLVLPCVGDIISGAARINLYDANFTVDVTTTAGSVHVEAFVDAVSPLMVVRTVATGGEGASRWAFTPGVAVSPRGGAPPPSYVKNPPAVCGSQPNTQSVAPHGTPLGYVHYCNQTLLAGGGYATAYVNLSSAARTLPASAAADYSLFVSVANSVPAAQYVGFDAATLAVRQLMAALGDKASAHSPDSSSSAHSPTADPAVAHRAYWHAFWARSFLTVPATTFESFYYIQLYKLGSATRCEALPYGQGGAYAFDNCWAFDLMGPWYQHSQWPDYHWDLNVQMAAWPAWASNHLDLGESLVRMVHRNLGQLASNVPANMTAAGAGALPANTGFNMAASCGMFISDESCLIEPPGQQLGDLAWTAQVLYTQYKYTQNVSALQYVVMPVLRQSVELYLAVAATNSSTGLMHLPNAESPEYGDASDTNYDLALFRWGAATLLHMCNDVLPPSVCASDPVLPKCTDALKRLVPPPTDAATGLLIGDSMELAHMHRHWSHLFAIFPTNIMNWDEADNATRALMVQSIDHWTGYNPPNGFSRAAGAAMSALLPLEGRAEASVGNVTEWLQKGLSESRAGNPFNLGPSTMYWEATYSPCNESPLGAAFALQFLLLQSWGGVVRVFPSVPAAWPDVSIAGMLAEGGVEVAAVRANGTTSWVQLTVSQATTVTLQCDMQAPHVSLAAVHVKALPYVGAAGVRRYAVGPIGAGATVMLWPEASGPQPPTPVVTPVAGNATEYHVWGKKAHSVGVNACGRACMQK